MRSPVHQHGECRYEEGEEIEPQYCGGGAFAADIRSPADEEQNHQRHHQYAAEDVWHADDELVLTVRAGEQLREHAYEGHVLLKGEFADIGLIQSPAAGEGLQSRQPHRRAQQSGDHRGKGISEKQRFHAAAQRSPVDVHIGREDCDGGDAQRKAEVEIGKYATAQREYVEPGALAAQQPNQAQRHQRQQLYALEEADLIAVHDGEAHHGVAGGEDQVAGFRPAQAGEHDVHREPAQGDVQHANPCKPRGEGLQLGKQGEQVGGCETAPGHTAPLVHAEAFVEGIKDILLSPQAPRIEHQTVQVPPGVGDGKAVLVAEGCDVQGDHRQCGDQKGHEKRQHDIQSLVLPGLATCRLAF